VHINAQLVDARTDTHLWAEQYNRDLSDVFAIESEVAQSIANRLRSKIQLAKKRPCKSGLPKTLLPTICISRNGSHRQGSI
jgi:adenylate cyclase